MSKKAGALRAFREDPLLPFSPPRSPPTNNPNPPEGPTLPSVPSGRGVGEQWEHTDGTRTPPNPKCGCSGWVGVV
eukprot:4035607-Pyramimonas_sp.AAC.1